MADVREVMGVDARLLQEKLDSGFDAGVLRLDRLDVVFGARWLGRPGEVALDEEGGDSVRRQPATSARGPSVATRAGKPVEEQHTGFRGLLRRDDEVGDD